MLAPPLAHHQRIHPPTAAPVADAPGLPTLIGVGIDTSRYGHYVAFLNDQLQTAAAELEVVESAVGYRRLRQRFADLVAKHGRVHFLVRVDAAGLYADNLLAWLDDLRMDNAEFSISCGDTQRNKNYRVAIYGHQKSDPVEARACARYALTERPKPHQPQSPQLRRLRQVACRLQAVVRQRTRLLNQLHQLLARSFPELAMLVNDIAVGWLLELLHRYPTAQRLTKASSNDLQNVPYLPHARVEELLARARDSVASLDGPLAEELVRDQVRQVRDITARQKRLENLLVLAYRDLPQANHLDSIPGFGPVTAAILTAFILDIGRFASEARLVNYFGVMPIEAASGFDRDGTPRGPKRYVMSPRGNDLVRRYLWMAALTAARFNPACRALYARVVAKHPDKKAIAVGHIMRKLVHLAFAIWKTGKPFDPNHYPWSTPAHLGRETPVADAPGSPNNEQAAGLRSGPEPIRQEVTTACAASVANSTAAVDDLGIWIDFAHLKRQLPIARVLDHLGLTPRLRGAGPQQRCACPIHRGDGRGRTFSVNLDNNVFQCFDARCQKHGDVIDLWAALHHLSLRDAALDLLRTFDLEPAPVNREEARFENG